MFYFQEWTEYQQRNRELEQQYKPTRFNKLLCNTPPNKVEYAFPSHTSGIFSDIGHIKRHKQSLNKHARIEII